MKKITQYLQHAEECRQLAKQITNPVHLRQLEDMTKAWEMLARERERQLATKKKVQDIA
jgi:hypothetical protein